MECKGSITCNGYSNVCTNGLKCYFETMFRNIQYTVILFCEHKFILHPKIYRMKHVYMSSARQYSNQRDIQLKVVGTECTHRGDGIQRTLQQKLGTSSPGRWNVSFTVT